MAIAVGTQSGLSGNTSPLGFSQTISVGHTVYVCVTMNPSSCAVTGITDNGTSGGNTYTKLGQIINTIKTEYWVCASATKSATTMSVAISGAITDASCLSGTWSGVVSLGPLVTASASTANASLAITTQDANNWSVTHFGWNDNNSTTAGTGNLRISDADVSTSDALVDNTVASPGSLTCSVTHAAFPWTAGALELRTSSGTTSFYLNNPVQGGSNAGLLTPTAPTASTSTTGWTVGTTGATNYSRMTYNLEVSAGNFTSTAQPSGVPVNSGEDCFRLSGVTTGQFSAGTWYSSVSVIAVSSGDVQDGRARFRLYRSANADLTSATELTQGAMVGSRTTGLSTSVAQSSSASTFIAASNLTNEFLIQQVAWEAL